MPPALPSVMRMAVTITCPDSEPVTLRDGAPGVEGARGPAGAAGADAEPCTAQDNGDGTYTITCPGSEPITIRDGSDGANGSNGDNGASGANGEPCTAEDHGDGTYTIRCQTVSRSPSETVRTAMMAMTVRTGEDGDDCRIEDNGDGTLTIRCGDEGPVVVRLPRCGDGVVAGGEECDDANLSNQDACTILCRHARCGDGVTRGDLEVGAEGMRPAMMAMIPMGMSAPMVVRPLVVVMAL